MADRGKPIPVPMRLALKAKRPESTVRQLASEFQVSKTTVQKYAGKIGTK